MEEGAVPAPPPPPPPETMVAKAKAGPPHGTRYDSDVSSSEDSGSPPRAAAASSKDAHGEDQPYGHGKGAGKGGKGGKGGRTYCPICWRPIANYASGQEQHRYYSQTCLQWQRYLRGGISWRDAGRWAEHTKNRRCDWEWDEPQIPERKHEAEAASPEARRNRKELKLTERKDREDRGSKKEKKRGKEKNSKKEKKADKKAKKVRKDLKWPSPSPSPPGKGKRGRKPPSSSDDEGGHGKPVIRQVGPGTFLVVSK